MSPRFHYHGLMAMVIGFGALVGLVPQGAAQVPESILNEEPAANTTPPIPDRIERFNRAVFKFNDGFYRVAWRPLAHGYTAVVPRPARRGLGNFFRNLGFPVRLAGNLLEGHGRGALKETGRFFVNTTVGVAGFIAVADRMPALKVPETDLGQAVATWGVGHGTYLVLPIIGPSSLRDGIGDIVSGLYLDPVQYLHDWEYRTAAAGANVVNQSPAAMHTYDSLTDAAIDPYVALRDAFASRRAQQVRDQLAARGELPQPAANGAKPGGGFSTAAAASLSASGAGEPELPTSTRALPESGQRSASGREP